MQITIINGAQFGDEGKGKVSYYLSKNTDVCIRCNGGSNAEHTFMHLNETYRFRMLPSGMLNGCTCVLTGNVILGVRWFESDINQIEEKLGKVGSQLIISSNAHLALPEHIDRDSNKKVGSIAAKIGTIGQGVGPAYADRRLRIGVSLKNYRTNHTDITADLPIDYVRQADLAASFIGDTGRYIAQRAADNPLLNVLIEGSQGFMLDIVHGTYPYVTSSETSSAGLLHGAGLSFSAVNRNIGVIKPYVTRYSTGAFVSRCKPDDEAMLRERGHEFSYGTENPMQCGWLDLVSLRYAQHVNGYTELCLNKLDIMSYLEEIPVCIGYRKNGEILQTVYDWNEMEQDEYEPYYQVLKGWETDICGLQNFEDLPLAAQDFIRFIEDNIGAPIQIIGTGPNYEDVIDRTMTTEMKRSLVA